MPDVPLPTRDNGLMAMQRRQLSQAQWLDALGIDSFWITHGSSVSMPIANLDSDAQNPESQILQADMLVSPRSSSAIVATITNGDADWDGLASRIRSCQTCSLCQKRKQAVPGSGDHQATWMLVGEAPGADEDMAGLPFVGKAGQLLDAMIAALGLNRTQGVYIANAVKCRPPENRTPETAEMDACNAFLNQQIAWIQPRVILALGRPAAYAVLGQEASIQSLRGRVHYRTQDSRKIPVVVTYHPAYLLRQPAEKGKAWQDLLLAQAALNP
jgi:uracil-DNA glycosylase